jgi:hypothetical protein
VKHVTAPHTLCHSHVHCQQPTDELYNMILLTVLSILLICIFVKCELMLIQPSPDFELAEFKTKYENFLKSVTVEYIRIGNTTVIIGDMNTDFLKSMYFDTSIKSINMDSVLRIADIESKGRANTVHQHFAPRHLARISQAAKIMRKQTMDYTFHLTDPVSVYILDTGINCKHPDFNGRAINRISKLTSIGGEDDPNGHGTAVASVIGSQLLGSCKNCNIIGYRLLDAAGMGRMSTLIKILSEISLNERPGVMVLPFITEKSVLLNGVLHELHSRFNFTIVAPAGNYNDDACKYSPASCTSVITVGSIDSTTDTISSFTNYGRCVDIFADGVNVFTLNHRYKNGKETDIAEMTSIKSGSSLSAGISAGVIAMLRGMNGNDIGEGEKADASLKMLFNVAIQDTIKPHAFFKKSQTKNRILCNYLGNI